MIDVLRRLATVAVITCMTSYGWAQELPSGTTSTEIVKGGVGIGGASGSGALLFEGQTYPFSIAGLTVGLTLGLTRADLEGEAFGLNEVADLEGTYTQQQAAVAMGGGVSRFVLSNNKGVRLELNGREEGLAVALDLGGIEIALKD